MKILSTVQANLRTQSLQEKFHHRLAALLHYQRPHKVTRHHHKEHIYFTVYELNIDFLYIPNFKNS